MIILISAILSVLVGALSGLLYYITHKDEKSAVIKTDTKIFNFDQVVTIDVDDTLVLWPESHRDYTKPASHTLPYEGAVGFKDPYDGTTNWLVPHQKHIDLIKKYKGRGFLVIVWSAGGVQWANSVVDSLGIRDYVDIILTKPSRYVDDLTCEKWMGNRVYIK